MDGLLLLIIILIFLFFVFYYTTGKDLLSPPIIMVIVFLLSSSFAFVNISNWNIDYSLYSTFLISTGIIAFFIPFYLFYYKSIRADNDYVFERFEPRDLNISGYKWVITIVIDILILYMYRRNILMIVHNSGYTGLYVQWYFRNLTSMEGSESLSASIRLLIKIMDASAYIGVYVFLNNVFISGQKVFLNLQYLIPSLLFCTKALLGGGRQDLLKIIAFAIIALYLLNHQRDGWDYNISMKYIIIGMVLLIVVLPGFHYALSLTGRNTTRTMFQAISTYVGGPIQHFNQYVMDPIPKSEFFGNECFTPILNLFGRLKLIDYHNTVHLEFRMLGVTRGNVYTFFRRPIQDFGVIGMYLFTVLVSVFFSYYYFTKIKYCRISLNSDINIIVYSYLLYWIVLSSVEQYSMTIISVQTLLTIIILRFMWKFFFMIEFDHLRIIIHPSDN